jgi:imidazolonepropionase-like amidohydrolase
VFWVRVFLSTLLMVGIPGIARAQASPPPLVLTNANLIDGVSSRARRGVTVYLRNGRIERIRAGTPERLPPDAGVLDLGGRWLMPGLIDAHVHFTGVDDARRALLAGVTTARSLGAPHYLDVEIRNAHRAGDASAPDLLAAGYHVRRRLHPGLFEDFPDLAPLISGVANAAAARSVVRANAERGADVIKLMATERAGDPQQDMLARDLDGDLLRATVGEARARGLPVAAHAHTDEAARDSVRAGVQTIEHGTLIEPATLRLMRARRVCLVPTLSFWLDMADAGGSYDSPILRERAERMLPRAQGMVRRAASASVLIAAGSDMRYDGVSRHTIVDEIEALAASGLSNIGAIQAATSRAARCIGIARRTGAVRAGLEADLLVLSRDPRADLSALRQIDIIINDGQIAYRR